MARHYGIPYMGSKQKLVDKIVPFILNRHPGVDSFYDLFGGGGSVSLYMVSKHPEITVHYNELSTAIGGLMQHLGRLERLIQIQNMPGISSLNITTGTGYDEVPITGEHPIIYCDPPYEGTTEYAEGGFNHKEFYDWVMAQKVPVYVSSYEVSDKRMKLVKAVKTRSLLDQKTRDSYHANYENIYWNGVS